MGPRLFLVRMQVSLLVLPALLWAGAARADDNLVLDLGGTTLETRHIVHGTFTQGAAGAAGAEAHHDKDEEPAHQVTITHDFWMGKFPVTRAQFEKFVTDTRYVTDAEKGQSGGAGWDGKALVQRKDFNWKSPGFTQTDEHPVVLVTYGDAIAFTGWASRKTGKRVRLPTEAEWEFAARGGTATPWYSGETENGAIGWFKSNAGNGTRPVGQKKPNALGLFDTSGNVFEWCRDVYGPYHDAAATDPELTTNTSAEPERRVLRGGSWLRDVKRARSSARYRNAPGSRNADNGFRVVVTNEELLGPGVGGATGDFAPASPVAVGSSNAASGGPTGPLADGDPTHLDPIAHNGEAFSWSVLLASPLGAASAVVAWMLLRRKRRPARAVGPAVAPEPAIRTRSGVSARASADGFFVRAPNSAPGSRVRYECIVNGTQVTDVVPLAGDETFVYTGAPPTGIRIVEIVAPAPGAYRTPDRPPADIVDPGLMPPSSRPRPPPVPMRPAPMPQSVPRVPAAPSSVPAILHTHTHTTTHHHHSSGRMLVVDPGLVPPSDPVPPPAPSSRDDVAPATTTDVATSEPFLGNPRAY